MKKLAIIVLLLAVTGGNAKTITRDDAINYYEKIRQTYDDISFMGLNNIYTAIGLSSKNIVDEDLKYLFFFPELKVLFLRNSNITNEGLVYLKDLNNLERLILEKTKITDDGLKYLKDLKSLQELDLFYTKVTDKGIQELSTLKNLKQLLLHGTKVTKKGINELKKKLPDCEITLASRAELG